VRLGSLSAGFGLTRGRRCDRVRGVFEEREEKMRSVGLRKEQFGSWMLEASKRRDARNRRRENR
jgi:hypothetical protein